LNRERENEYDIKREKSRTNSMGARKEIIKKFFHWIQTLLMFSLKNKLPSKKEKKHVHCICATSSPNPPPFIYDIKTLPMDLQRSRCPSVLTAPAGTRMDQRVN
jgi:hypothetical protein